MSKAYPGLNRLLVKKEDLPKGDSILSYATEAYSYGTIVAVGSLKDKKEFNEDHFKEGDGVYYLPHSGVDIDIEGTTLRLIQANEVLVGLKKEG